jgi:predicted Zn-dependent protease
MKAARHTARSKARRAAGPPVAAAHLPADAELHRIAERVLKLSDADETEVDIAVNADALTRFANNTIHQNVAELSLTVSVRTVFGGRTARATTNKTDEESLRRVVATSGTLARSQPKDPNLLPLPSKQKYAKVARFDAATAGATPADRARAVERVAKLAALRNQTAAGIFTTGASASLLANSRGLIASYRQTRAEFSVTMIEADSSGWAKANSPALANVDPQSLAERASDKAILSRQPRELEPGPWTVILEPAAVLDLVGFLFYDFAATAVRDKRSCFTGRIGKKLMGDNITLWDDAFHPLQTGPPYDGEGIPRQRVMLVDAGVPKNLVYSRASAKKMKAKPTGHGFSLPNEWGEAPFNLVFTGGGDSVEQMIATTERGILVTRLWYIREVDPYEKVLTGMTRDGTFLVENGAVVSGARNFRFNQSVLEMLRNVVALGPAVRSTGEESFDMVVPAMKVNGFRFSEVTKF